MNPASVANIPLFSALEKDNLKQLASLWRPVRATKNQQVFRKGDPGDAMYIIEAGSVAVSIWTPQNEEIVVSVLGPGDFFGELSLFDAGSRTANVRALEDSELRQLSRESFDDFLRSNPQVAAAMIPVLAKRFRATNDLLEQRTTRNVNHEVQLRSTFWDRISDRVAAFGGSWPFISISAVFIILWIALNSIQLAYKPFDPFPFIFLNLVLQCAAAFQAPVIMMSQNREALKDRLSAELEYRVNLKAELQIGSLHVKMDELRATELHQLLKMQEELRSALNEQATMIERILPPKGESGALSPG